MRINVVIEGHAYPAQVPGDMRTSDFIEEVRDQRELDGDWLLRDKDGRRPLDPDRTLDENGVREGQNLFAEPLKPVPVEPDKPVISADPHEYRPRPNSGTKVSGRPFLLVLAFIAIALGFAVLGYAMGNSVNSSAQRESERLRAEVEKLHQEVNTGKKLSVQAEEATQRLDEEKAQHLDQLAKATADTTALQHTIAGLNKEMAQLKLAASDARDRAKQATTELDTSKQTESQLRGRIDALLKANHDLEASAGEARTKLARAEAQSAELRNPVNRRRNWGVVRFRVDKVKSGSVIEVVRNHPSQGDFTPLAGDGIGAAAGQVFIGNPEVADVRMQPSQGDGHFQITMKKSGRQEMLIFWGAN